MRPQTADGSPSQPIRLGLLDGAQASALLTACARADWRPVLEPDDGGRYDVADVSLEPDAILAAAKASFPVSRIVGLRAVRLAPGAWISRLTGGEGAAGFLLDLNPVWRSEWGGLTLLSAGPDSVKGFRPQAGVLTLFAARDAPMISLVTSDAAEPRLSILGRLA